MLYLKEANHADAAKEYAFLRGLPQCENGFMNPCFGASEEEFISRLLPQMIGFARGEGLPAGWVPESFLFLWEDDEIVGLFRLRHSLTDELRRGAGHIGYSIAHDRRGRGLAARGLALALEYARGVVRDEEIYMSANIDNPASLRVQQKNGARIVKRDAEKHHTRIKLR